MQVKLITSIAGQLS